MNSLFLLLIFLFGAWPEPVMAAPTEKEIETAMGERLMRTPEFAYIRAEAEKLGVKVYLFGGTASAYAHYVRQDLARDAGDSRYAGQNFDYDYTKIFRSTQDLDVVIDGSAEQAEKLEKALKEKYPHFVGAKSNKWEVRPLRVARGEKEAILDNAHFQNQHTDSHSTGMVEVTSPKGDPLVRDVRDWNGKTPQFLKDVAQQKLHFYWSPKHEQTQRFLQGKNPPIVAAIRYYTKAFQYDLAIPSEDLKKLKEIVDAFDPTTLNSDYVKDWIERNGKKLYMHAVDLERAVTDLDKVGLRQKLLMLSPDVNKADTLGWWLNREPLRSHDVGQGDGKTAAEIAKELGEEKLVVSHETKGFIPYESLTRDRSGELNAFISRKGRTDEAAVHGEGFYTRIGRKGARNTGYTIRMELLPTAREGTDFLRFDDYIVVKNKKAVRVIPEGINLSLAEFFRQIAETGKGWDQEDRALLEAFKRRVGRDGFTTEADIKEINSIVRKAFAEATNETSLNLSLVQEWLALPESVGDLALLEKIHRAMGDNKNHEVTGRSLAKIFSQPHWLEKPEILEILTRTPGVRYPTDSPLIPLLTKSTWKDQPAAIALIEKLLDASEENGYLLGELITSEHWLNHPRHPELWKKFLSSHHNLDRAAVILGSPQTNEAKARNMEMLRDLLRGRKADNGFADLLTHSQAWGLDFKEEIMDALVEHGNIDNRLAEYLLSRTDLLASPRLTDWFFGVLERGKEDKNLVRKLKFLPNENQARAFQALLNKGTVDLSLVFALSEPPTNSLPQARSWMKTLALRSPDVSETLIGNTFKNYNIRNSWEKVDWTKVPEAVEIVNAAVRSDMDPFPVLDLLKEKEWTTRPEAGEWLREIIRRSDVSAQNIIFQHRILELPEWKTHHPEIYADIQKYGDDAAKLQQVWRQRHSPVSRPPQQGNHISIHCQISFGQFK